MARAVRNNKLKYNAYSIRLVPQSLALPIAKSPTVPADRSPEELLMTSFLTLGGWDDEDMKGDIAWLPAGDGWNQTLSKMTLDGKTIVDEYDVAPVMFETGYPYIGMTQRFFDIFSVDIRQSVPNMDCEAGSHWGICRVKDKCENVDLSQKLEFTIGDYDFTLPLQNIATYVK